MNLPLNIHLQQVLLHMFNLVILFGALYFILYKPVKKFMDGRLDYYKDLDEQAKASIAEAEATKTEYEEKYASMAQDIEKDRAAARAEIAQARDAQIAEAKAEADKIVEKARVKAEAERDRILANVQDNTWDLITKAAKDIFLNNTSDAYDSFLASAEEQDK